MSTASGNMSASHAPAGLSASRSTRAVSVVMNANTHTLMVVSISTITNTTTNMNMCAGEDKRSRSRSPLLCHGFLRRLRHRVAAAGSLFRVPRLEDLYRPDAILPLPGQVLEEQGRIVMGDKVAAKTSTCNYNYEEKPDLRLHVTILRPNSSYNIRTPSKPLRPEYM